MIVNTVDVKPAKHQRVVVTVSVHAAGSIYLEAVQPHRAANTPVDVLFTSTCVPRVSSAHNLLM